ncbi:uncharacterized protein Eint_080940 [Encephalitozoon intestinalis ATCC 50506]|uniref:Uncharacterized protein n=1 Tax=Encephalitozoon intestinalis (strain ATCC 50506) TaxID=876142 RepID=E0S8P3_ENCIT|nr:uncharacterized protein Eint_080940 [Encephalitozoon intestinalis ATCC 50506]ADM12026.1 hypothetical protein Eint_080940 [Encephalitozoon intestinalis ATCC 50506]UTX45815.1 hypothetical protein GPK93_08g13940 [Encephalitozoon intestinalis]
MAFQNLLRNQEALTFLRILGKRGRKVRIGRKAVEKIWIPGVVKAVVDIFPVYALRGASVFLQMLIRIYKAKVRIQLLEIRSLAGILDRRKKRRRTVERKKKNMLSIETGYVASVCSSELDGVDCMDSIMFSYSETFGVVDGPEHISRKRL